MDSQMTLFSLISTIAAAEYGSLYSINEMNALSSRIVEAEIIDKESYLKEGKIYSKLILDVQETYTGIEENQLELHVLGGTYNGLEMQVSGLPDFEIGSSSLFFLNHSRVLGFAQGVFSVSKKTAIRKNLTGLPDQQFELKSLPNEGKASNCLGPIIDAQYQQGWNLKHLYSHHSKSNQANLFPFSTYAELSYKIVVCHDGKPQDIAVDIINDSNQLITKDHNTEDELSLEFQAQTSGVHHLRIALGKNHSAIDFSAFAIAILYQE